MLKSIFLQHSISWFHLVVLCILNTAFAQVDTVWVRRYTGPGAQPDIPTAVIVDDDGYIYITGTSYASNRDMATLKYTPTGDTVWVRRYNGPHNDEDWAIDMTMDQQGNIYILGTTRMPGAHDDLAILKYSQDGTLLWEVFYSGPGVATDYANAITCDTAGYIYVAGCSNWDFITIKYTPSGDTLWTRRYNGTYNGTDGAQDIICDSACYVYVTGYSQIDATTWEYVTFKYNTDGITQWRRPYSMGYGRDEGRKVLVDNSGNVYVTGLSKGSSSDFDYCTIKYNADGDTLWVRRYNGPDNQHDAAYLMTMDSNEYITITGSSQVSETNFDIVTVKYNQDGDTLWSRRYNGPWDGHDYPSDITSDSFNNIYVTGHCEVESGNSDCITLKYSPYGGQLWSIRYDYTNSNDDGQCIRTDDSGYVYVGAGSSAPSTDRDYALIKYSQETGVAECMDSHASKTLLWSAPNPFDGKILVKYSLSRSCVISLVIYNAVGARIKTLLNETQNSGNHSVVWHGTDDSSRKLPSGVYFLKLKAGDYSATEKLLLIR